MFVREMSAKEETRKVLMKYPERVPVYIELDKNLKLDKHKYLVPKDMTLAQFIFVVKKRTIESGSSIKESHAIYVLVSSKTGKIVPRHTDLLSELYAEHKHADDDMLRLFIGIETFFG